MSKHTPGPWVVRGAYIGAGECDLAMMTRPNPNDSEVIAEWDANAQLIAAAPDLLKACMMMDKAMTEQQVDKALDFVKSAISKAKGSSHE